MNHAQIKICGLTRFEDAKLASELGAYALGFIFYEKSPRFIAPEVAGTILSRLNASLRVGVFVNASLDEIIKAIKLSHINTVQLHGDEAPEFSAELRARFPKLNLIKVLRPPLEQNSILVSAQGYDFVDFILVDAYSQKEFGGTGHISNWKAAREVAAHFPLILSGGLTSNNVAEALAHVKPAIVDVSSGIEEAPGIKSPEMMKAFFRSVAEYES